MRCLRRNTGSKYLHGIHRPPWAKSDIIPAFGEHLLKRDGHAMVVEAAKTALIMTCLFLQSTWIATLGASRLNAFLKRNRDVQFILFPDNDLPGKNWVDIANRDGHKVCTSFWEQCQAGEDVADVVLRNRQNRENEGFDGV